VGSSKSSARNVQTILLVKKTLRHSLGLVWGPGGVEPWPRFETNQATARSQYYLVLNPPLSRACVQYPPNIPGQAIHPGLAKYRNDTRPGRASNCQAGRVRCSPCDHDPSASM
jgi:hypothetical protein